MADPIDTDAERRWAENWMSGTGTTRDRLLRYLDEIDRLRASIGMLQAIDEYFACEEHEAEIDRLRAALVHREGWSGSVCPCDRSEGDCPVEGVEWYPPAVSPKDGE
jgi:hypothetical protein